MPNLANLVPTIVLQTLTLSEKGYLADVFTRFKGYPSLTQIWQLIDEQWVAYGCDPGSMDERVTAFYRHPVWLLNGLFIEQHSQSIDNRRVFTEWVASQGPVRVADFGGGFGGLARFIGKALPSSQIEVIDPYPHPAGIACAASTPNVRFAPELNGDYDMLIATDVFEHVLDPIGLVADTALHLRVGGQYLVASCFQPVILCHLPQNFHLNAAWEMVMQAMGLEPGERVLYGREYRRSRGLDVSVAREIGERARKVYPWVKYLPQGRLQLGSLAMSWLCR